MRALSVNRVSLFVQRCMLRQPRSGQHHRRTPLPAAGEANHPLSLPTPQGKCATPKPAAKAEAAPAVVAAAAPAAPAGPAMP